MRYAHYHAYIDIYKVIKHGKQHPGDKPYKCDTCDNKKTHTGEKPYNWDQKEKFFPSKGSLVKN